MFAALAAATARKVVNVITLAAGLVLLLVAGLHLAPEAIGAGGTALVFLLVGAGAGVVLELVVDRKANPSPGTVQLAAWIGLAVLALHSTIDGAVYSAAFGHSHGSGVLTSIGLILHEAPEGVVAMMLGLQAGLRPGAAALAAFAASSITTPIGWALGRAVGERGHEVMEAMFAASAGLLLYVGWHLATAGWRAMRRRAS